MNSIQKNIIKNVSIKTPLKLSLCFKTLTALISILSNEIRRFTSSRFPDRHAECNNVSSSLKII